MTAYTKFTDGGIGLHVFERDGRIDIYYALTPIYEAVKASKFPRRDLATALRDLRRRDQRHDAKYVLAWIRDWCHAYPEKAVAQ